jgi:hypothetical protein
MVCAPASARPTGGASCWRRWGWRQSTRGRYPHEFSGGQRQRIGIARALAVRARTDRLRRGRSRRWTCRCRRRWSTCCRTCSSDCGLAYIFIAHDLAVVKHIADRIAVMYLGRMVETRQQGRPLRGTAPSLYPGAALCHPPARAWHPAATNPAGRRCAQPGQATTGLRLSHPLPACAKPAVHRSCRP